MPQREEPKTQQETEAQEPGLKLSKLALRLSLQDKTLLALMRIPALFCLCLGIYYWIRLIGAVEGALWRFDLMPWYWRVMACSLAVVYPIAACGLWTASRWGIALWLAGALWELCAYGFYAADFGHNYLILGLHCLFLAFYAVLALWLRHNRRPEPQAVAEY